MNRQGISARKSLLTAATLIALAGVLPDFEHSTEKDEVRTGAWRFFLRENLPVSGRRTALRGVHETWRSFSQGALPPRADVAYQRVRRAFLDEAARLAGVLQTDLDRVEDDLLETEGQARRRARAGACSAGFASASPGSSARRSNWPA